MFSIVKKLQDANNALETLILHLVDQISNEKY